MKSLGRDRREGDGFVWVSLRALTPEEIRELTVFKIRRPGLSLVPRTTHVIDLPFCPIPAIATTARAMI